VYQACVEQLGFYLPDLRHLANLVDAAHLVLGNVRAEEEHFLEEIKKEIAERARHLDEIGLAIKAFQMIFRGQSSMLKA